METAIKQPGFRQWIERSLERGENILAVSNQGTVLHYRAEGRDWIVKTAMGSGLLRKARERTLQREFRAYRRMQGLAGIPRCHGMVDGQFLVIDFIRGTPYREARFEDREQWFREFLDIIRAFHSRGVSHGDLKSKSNILVTDEQKPCVIDFGTAFMQEPGFHPVNNRLFEHGRRMDINAWVKHKYHGRYEDIGGEDLELLDYSFVEYWVRHLRGRPMKAAHRKK
jgi:predicted Ser/Thr protein kinase